MTKKRKSDDKKPKSKKPESEDESEDGSVDEVSSFRVALNLIDRTLMVVRTYSIGKMFHSLICVAFKDLIVKFFY